MKNFKTILILLVIIFVVWLVKFSVGFPSVNIDIIGVILSIASIFFGLLVGFFISSLWSRYTEIRSLQGERSSAGLEMIKLAEAFYPGNKKFETQFKKLTEQSALVDEIISWDEGDLEEPYYYRIADSFKLAKVKNDKEQVVYFQELVAAHKDYFCSTVKMNILYRERLFFTEWLILVVLSLVIFFSVLFLDTSHILYQIMVFTFPPVIFLALAIIYDLNNIKWNRELITLEPTQIIFDTLGVKRFYLKKDKGFVSRHVKGYRTEDHLSGDLKKVYLDILENRKLKRE